MELKHGDNSVPWENLALLIVPYGIETTTSDLRKIPTLAFNRTLWN